MRPDSCTLLRNWSKGQMINITTTISINKSSPRRAHVQNIRKNSDDSVRKAWKCARTFLSENGCRKRQWLCDESQNPALFLPIHLFQKVQIPSSSGKNWAFKKNFINTGIKAEACWWRRAETNTMTVFKVESNEADLKPGPARSMPSESRSYTPGSIGL